MSTVNATKSDCLAIKSSIKKIQKSADVSTCSKKKLERFKGVRDQLSKKAA